MYATVLIPCTSLKTCALTLLTPWWTRGDIEGFTSHTPGHATLGNQEGAASHGAREWLVWTSNCITDIEEGRKACAYFFLQWTQSPDRLLCEPKEASEHERTQVQLWPYEGPWLSCHYDSAAPCCPAWYPPPKVRTPIIKLCLFFNVISKKVIVVSTLEQL